MSTYDTILAAYPELTTADFNPLSGLITLLDDGDGVVYLAKWEYSKPIPAVLKLGK